ncbi:LacI family DNA-binding transcriptional regulator [Leifsonia poae]|uniref:LacI family DNA-binding transcriptional regulator n=1 Tax=Leifsonia poae TaxID=110933 RepID=UPI001CC165B1|nr:LacI family DNA-binding transcriptional regulator [Leifsonia poae]
MSLSRPVLTDVARIAGVSPMTVSNVMNGKAVVAESTRRKVLDAAESIGYVPNIAARGLARGRTNLIGVISHDLTVQYAWSIVQGITNELADEGVELLLSVTYQDASREVERIRFLTSGLVDGVILIAPALEPEALTVLASSRVPAVVIDPRRLDVPLPRVIADNYAGARSAVDHLTSLGHRRIAIIDGDASFDSAAERHRGYADGLLAAGITPDPALTAVGDFTQSRGFAAALELLDQPLPPTAIFATADVSAMGAVDAARSLGLDVPRDLSVVGFDDIPQSAQSFPALTTVRQPLEVMGHRAVRMLIDLIDGGAATPDPVRLPTELVVRETVSPARTL